MRPFISHNIFVKFGLHLVKVAVNCTIFAELPLKIKISYGHRLVTARQMAVMGIVDQSVNFPSIHECALHSNAHAAGKGAPTC